MAQKLIPVVHAGLGQTASIPERRLDAARERGWVPVEDARVQVDETGAIERPPGNAPRDAWAIYARSQGATVTDDMGRDDIRDMFPDPDQADDGQED